MKKCPFCQKKIESDEIQCRHCGEWLDIIAPPKKKIKLVSTPVKKQTKYKKIWDDYGNIIIAMIIIIVIVITYKFYQKDALEGSAKQTTKITSSKTDRDSILSQKSSLEPESASEQEPVTSRTMAEDLFKKALALCTGGKCTDPQKALEYLNEAIKLEPNLVQAYNNRGLIYSDLGQHQQAVENYTESIRRKPDYASAYYNRGCSYGSLGQTHNAIEDYNESIRLKPDDVDSYYNRAIAYLAQGNKEQGCSDAQKACELGDCKALDGAKAKRICR